MFILSSILCLLWLVYAISRSWNFRHKGSLEDIINKLKQSQEQPVETAKTEKEIAPKDSRLEIIKAEYWTQKATLDVTEELRKIIVDNKLETIASNDIKGDPDIGTGKKLTIQYKFDGIALTKEFSEGHKVVIP